MLRSTTSQIGAQFDEDVRPKAVKRRLALWDDGMVYEAEARAAGPSSKVDTREIEAFLGCIGPVKAPRPPVTPAAFSATYALELDYVRLIADEAMLDQGAAVGDEEDEPCTPRASSPSSSIFTPGKLQQQHEVQHLQQQQASSLMSPALDDSMLQNLSPVRTASASPCPQIVNWMALQTSSSPALAARSVFVCQAQTPAQRAISALFSSTTRPRRSQPRASRLSRGSFGNVSQPDQSPTSHNKAAAAAGTDAYVPCKSPRRSSAAGSVFCDFPRRSAGAAGVTFSQQDQDHGHHNCTAASVASGPLSCESPRRFAAAATGPFAAVFCDSPRRCSGVISAASFQDTSMPRGCFRAHEGLAVNSPRISHKTSGAILLSPGSWVVCDGRMQRCGDTATTQGSRRLQMAARCTTPTRSRSSCCPSPVKTTGSSPTSNNSLLCESPRRRSGIGSTGDAENPFASPAASSSSCVSSLPACEAPIALSAAAATLALLMLPPPAPSSHPDLETHQALVQAHLQASMACMPARQARLHAHMQSCMQATALASAPLPLTSTPHGGGTQQEQPGQQQQQQLGLPVPSDVPKFWLGPRQRQQLGFLPLSQEETKPAAPLSSSPDSTYTGVPFSF